MERLATGILKKLPRLALKIFGFLRLMKLTRLSQRLEWKLIESSGLFFVDCFEFSCRAHNVFFENENHHHQHLKQIEYYLKEWSQKTLVPNPLFDSQWYRQEYLGENCAMSPLTHYILFGAGQGFAPCRDFDPPYYISCRNERGISQRNALLDFFNRAEVEGVGINFSFDSLNYLTRNQGEVDQGKPALIDYVWKGRHKNLSYLPKAKLTDFDIYPSHNLSNGGAANPLNYPYVEYIIIYSNPTSRKGVLNLLSDLLEKDQQTDANILFTIIIGNEISDSDQNCLNQFRQRGPLKIWVAPRSKPKLGAVQLLTSYLRTTSLTHDYVIIFNSEINFNHSMAKRMQAQAYVDEKIALIAPLGTFCPVSGLKDSISHLLEEDGARDFGRFVNELNKNVSCDVLVSDADVYFVKGVCLTESALWSSLNEFGGKQRIERLGQTRFFIALKQKGLKHKIACNIFVKSQTQSTLQLVDSQGVDRFQRYLPPYQQLLFLYQKEPPLLPVFFSLLSNYMVMRGHFVSLIVTHSLGGGTERHINDLIQYFKNKVLFFVLHIEAPDCLWLTIKTEFESRITINLSSEGRGQDFSKLCALLHVYKIHIQHFLHFPDNLFEFLRATDLPIDVTLNDYFVACPHIFMISEKGIYCESNSESQCNECLKWRPKYGCSDIALWRGRFQQILEKARYVLCPSFDTLHRMGKIFNKINLKFASHLELERPPQGSHFTKRLINLESHFKQKFETGKIRIGLLGHLAIHKGLQKVFEVAKLAQLGSLDIEFVVIGRIEEDPEIAMELGKYGNVNVFGGYDDRILSDLVANLQLDFLWYASTVPETYSFTLTAGLRSGLPIVATEIGAFIERLKDHSQKWLVPLSMSALDILNLFLEIDLLIRNSPKRVGTEERNMLKAVTHFYQNEYL